MRATVLAIMSLTLLASTGDHTVPTLHNTTDLSDSPDGRRLGVLLSGAPVRILERDGTWAKISVEGWIHADDIGSGTVEAPQAAGRTGRISGSIFITEDDGSTAIGSAIAVRLVRDTEAYRAAVDSLREACDSRRTELASEIDELKKQGDSAMRRVEDTSEAFSKYDEAKSLRLRAQKTLEAHDRDCDSRLEKAVESNTATRTITSTDGRYELPEVEPGRYILHVSLDSGEGRHMWDVEISLGPGEELIRDLTGDNRTRRIYP